MEFNANNILLNLKLILNLKLNLLLLFHLINLNLNFSLSRNKNFFCEFYFNKKFFIFIVSCVEYTLYLFFEVDI